MPPGRHSFFHVFLKVDVSRARDDRFRGPESIINSKRRKVVASRRRNTCLWEAINTNIPNFTNLRPRLARVSQWHGRCLARTLFLGFPRAPHSSPQLPRSSQELPRASPELPKSSPKLPRPRSGLQWLAFWPAVARVLACGGSRSGLRWLAFWLTVARVLAYGSPHSGLRRPAFWLAVARVLACGGPRSGLRWPAFWLAVACVLACGGLRWLVFGPCSGL